MRENANTYRGEIRKVLERSYKSEYEKLLKEEKEDEEVSGQVHENLKITFLMKENINNFLFTRPQTGFARGSCAEAKNCSTFSDHIFANAKVLLSTKRDAPFGSSHTLEEWPQQEGQQQQERQNCQKKAVNEEDHNPMSGSLTEEGEGEQKLFTRSNVSAIELFKHNVNAFLSYKKENIIKNNLHEDLLYGRVKVHWFPKFMKKIITKMADYIKISDVIVEVRNGIIPFVFDDLHALDLFNFRTNKPKIIVYTNCDRSSIKGNEEWGSYYRRKLFWYDKNFNKKLENKEGMQNQLKKSAVIFVDAKNGKKEIIVLKN
ncbi:hypothetical GTP binding protein 2 [Plasmodium cynomolgi strain B]|uniref:Hypothetical GTP binding protein 2 n=1 Tax=Plasmodium cynomolgi (strain B) TaxID=1120755 RepID=K6UPW5_PLACD|nr:hypothetical GTP binding protein 2 [Plasmodium cynomolgi strain B]GAB64769.1 hypothetical GTP binding protein 2 [Plasmodium cynomolgi strain B]